jgi:hypothetical protein
MIKISEYGRGAFNQFGINLRTSSEHHEKNPYNYLSLYFFKWYVWIKIPQIIKMREKPVFKNGELWFTDHIKKVYGLIFSDNSIYMHYGIQPGCWISGNKKDSDHTFYWEYPWESVYQCKYELLDVDTRDVVYSHDAVTEILVGGYDPSIAAANNVKKAKFTFTDNYDGATINASAHIERRTYRTAFKRHWMWSWLRFIIKDKAYTSMWVECDELGPKKGSWKGGVTGFSVELKTHQTLEDALREKLHADQSIGGSNIKRIS